MSQIQRFFAVLFFSSLLAIAGCSKSGSSAGLEKPDTDGDGIADIYDPDMDGDGIPNGQDPDIDGDGIPNDKDKDMDGDGKPNGKDPDPENNDPNYCDRIQVFGLSDEQTIGSEIELTWYLQSSKTDGDCVVKEGVKADLIQVTASAVGADETKSEETNPLARAATRIQIPLACTGDTVEVTYDFTEIATLIKADPNAPGWTVKQRHKADPERCDIDGDGSPDFGPAQCPTGATGTYPSCSCPDGEGYDVSSNTCLDIGAGVGNLDCPISATGTFPNCTCEQGYEFNSTSNSCRLVSNECTNVDINWPDKSVKLGESATITWSFIPEGCQLADEDARLTLTVKHNTDPNAPTESVSANAIERSASLTLPCFTNTSQTLKYEMTGIDEAFGYETGLPLVKTGSHDPATSCPSEPPEPDNKICGVDKDNFFIWQSPSAYSGIVEACASYAGAPARRVATLAETQCLCNAGEFSGAKTSFWTSTKDSDGKHWLVDKGSCTAFEVKDPAQSSTGSGLMAACVTD